MTDFGRFYSTKTYGHEQGLSCCFRQPNATHSHCSLLHGYALSFKFTFAAENLDDKNWVQDFGGLKDLKQWLKENFDHTWAVDRNDPMLSQITDFVGRTEVADIRVFDGVGCEKFAEHASNFADQLVQKLSNGRVWVEEVEVREHNGNSAIYRGKEPTVVNLSRIPRTY